MFGRDPKRRTKRKLVKLTNALGRARAEVSLLESQLGTFDEDAEEAHIATLLSGRRATRTDRESEEYAALIHERLDAARREVTTLEVRRDALLLEL